MQTLSYYDVEAMRRASAVVFVADDQGRAKARLTLQRNDPANFTKAEAHIFPHPQDHYLGERIRTIRLSGHAKTTSGLMNHGPDPLAGKRLVGVEIITSAAYHPGWTTIARLVKPGQALEVQFLADHGTNTHLRHAGLHLDEMHVRIWTLIQDRWQAAHEFLLSASVTPHDSSRMVRAEGDAEQAMTHTRIEDYWTEEVYA